MMRTLFRFVVASLLAALSPALRAQDGKNDDEVVRTPVDPYTGGDVAVLKASGAIGYGPFPWADGVRTEDIDRVLGNGRVLWLETQHFRIGCNLAGIKLPEAQAPKKVLLDECKHLHDLMPKVPERPRRLDPWLRMHIYAQRAEALYTDFESMLGEHAGKDGTGKEPPGGRYLGLPDKFLLLLFQKKSDLARYLDRFCSSQGERSYGYYHLKTHQMVFGVSVEGLENGDDAALFSHVVYGQVANFVNGYRGYTYAVPPWFAEGLAHWYSRRVDTNFVNITIKDEDNVDPKQQHEWAKKVRARLQYDRTTIPLATLQGVATSADLGYHMHLQSWSRIDFLMARDRVKLGEVLFRVKSLPPGSPASAARDALAVALADVTGLDAAALDAQWREWVLKTYPKK